MAKHRLAAAALVIRPWPIWAEAALRTCAAINLNLIVLTPGRTFLGIIKLKLIELANLRAALRGARKR